MINSFLGKYVDLLEQEDDEAGEYFITLLELGVTAEQIKEWTKIILFARELNSKSRARFSD